MNGIWDCSKCQTNLFVFASFPTEFGKSLIDCEKLTELREDPAEFGQLHELSWRHEDKTPRMDSAIKIVPPARRDGILEGEMSPYIPSFSVLNASDTEACPNKVHGTTRPMEVEASEKACDLACMVAGALGEARFRGTESADKPTDPPSIFVRSRCNQLSKMRSLLTS